jgi:hypothetical protein
LSDKSPPFLAGRVCGASGGTRRSQMHMDYVFCDVLYKV